MTVATPGGIFFLVHPEELTFPVVLPVPTISLEVLFDENGTTFAEVASKVGVDPLLFRRVDAGRQPLPIAVANLIAQVIPGMDVATVLWAARTWTNLDSPAMRTPAPRELGDPI